MNFDNIKNSIRILPSKQLKEYLGRSDVLIFDLRDKKDYDLSLIHIYYEVAKQLLI